MKNLILGVWVAGASLLAASAGADEFTIIRDGRNYLCRSTDAPTPPGQGAAACAEAAYRGVFSREESLLLCEGAWGTGPAECAIAAYRGIFSREECVRLCARTGTAQTAECANQAYRGPYSREEAIRLCRAAPAALLRSLAIMETLRLQAEVAAQR